MNKSGRYWASIAYFHYLESEGGCAEEDRLHAFYDEHKICYGLGWFRSEYLDCFSDELFWHFISNVSGLTKFINEELGLEFGQIGQMRTSCARIKEPPFANQSLNRQPLILDKEPLC